MPENMRAAPTAHLVPSSDATHSKGDTDIVYLAVGMVHKKSRCVGEIGEYPTTGSIHAKDGVGSALQKKRKKGREREREKEKNERRDRRKRERKRKRGSIHFQGRVRSDPPL